MCCGSKRAALRNTSTSAPSTTPLVSQSAVNRAQIPSAPRQNPVATTASVSAREPSPWVVVRYIESSAVRVRGPVTGWQYNFSGARPAQAVDPRDAAVLLRNSMFRRA
jgi:hypothetical protein